MTTKKENKYHQGIDTAGATVVLGIVGLGLGLKGIVFPTTGWLQLLYVCSWPALIMFFVTLFLLFAWIIAYISSGDHDSWTTVETQKVFKWFIISSALLFAVGWIWWQAGGDQKAGPIIMAVGGLLTPVALLLRVMPRFNPEKE